MKLILYLLIISSTINANAQQMKMIVSARNNSITVVADSDNDNKVLLINPLITNTVADYLTVKVTDEQIRQTWKRSFYVYDDDHQIMAELKPMQQNEYCIKLKDLLPKLNKDKEYTLYSIIIPQDQTKSMAVKIPPLFICKIKFAEN